MVGDGVRGSLELTSRCGEAYFRYQLVFAHVSSSFSVQNPSGLDFWGKASQLTGVPHLASLIYVRETASGSFRLFVFIFKPRRTKSGCQNVGLVCVLSLKFVTHACNRVCMNYLFGGP